MQPETLNTLSYLMGLALMFNVGYFIGGYMQRRAIVNTFANGVQRVETLFMNLFKRGKDANSQADNADHATHYYDGVGVHNSPPWEKIREGAAGGDARAAGLGSRAPADYQGTGQQGRESVSGEAGGEEGGFDRAGAAA